MCVHKKQIHQDIFNFKQYNFQLKYLKSIIHNISIWTRREICTDQASFTSENSPKQLYLIYNKYAGRFFFTFLLLIMDLYLGDLLKDGFVSYKHISLHKTLIDGLESSGLLVNYCDVFISCLDSHSDGTHSLQRIHW